MELQEKIELIALILHQSEVDRTIDQMGMEPGDIRVRRDLAIADFTPHAMRVLSALQTGPGVCLGCVRNAAAFCETCAELGLACGHASQMRYCAGCASVRDAVDEVVALDQSADHRVTDFEMWAAVSVKGASVAELRDIAGWKNGWRLQDGSAWPYRDVTDDD